MPVIHTHVSVSTTPAQRDALKAAYGKAISAVPGKASIGSCAHSRTICRFILQETILSLQLTLR